MIVIPTAGRNLQESLPLERLCRNTRLTFEVILNEVKNLIITGCKKNEILRLTAQNDIMTQPLTGEGQGGVKNCKVVSEAYPPPLHPLPRGEGMDY